MFGGCAGSGRSQNLHPNPAWGRGGTHHVVVVVGAPEVRAVASTEVGFITFGLVDPFPVEVTSEVDVERAQAATLV